MQLIKFPSIEQYRNTVRAVQHKAQFKGFGIDGTPIIDKSAMMPILDFTGTVKLHGTNAGVAFDSNGGYLQRRHRHDI